MLWTARIRLSVLLLASGLTPLPGAASTRPQYGGTLHIELHDAAVELDPRKWKAGSQESATSEHFAALLFDRLVSLDNYGHFQPQLAVEWSHDASLKRWQFQLRSGVKFSDGSPLTPGDVATSLQNAVSPGIQITAFNNSVLFQSGAPIPDLLEQLASGRCFIYREAGGALLGTGPFVLSPQTGERVTGTGGTTAQKANENLLRFRAQDQCWAGRPFVDRVEVALGVAPLRALFDLQLGKAEIVILAPEVVRRALQSGVRMWASDPVTLYLVSFDETSKAVADPGLRESLALSLDRSSMAGVLLQKQADPAASFLPQWLSGYALLFEMNSNLQRAKGLRLSLPPTTASSAQPLVLRIEATGDVPRLVGERVAVNARQAGLFVQTAGRTSVASTTDENISGGKVALRLLTWRYTSLSPRAELQSMLTSLHLDARLEKSAESVRTAHDLEQLHEVERLLVENREVLPLVVFPDYVGLGSSVRDWMPNSWGEWHLEDVWIDRAERSPVAPGAASPEAEASGARP